MKVIITGGAGFLGGVLARELTRRDTLVVDGGERRIDAIVLQDIATPQVAVAGLDGRSTYVTGDISDRDFIHGLVTGKDLCVFHLASIVSAAGERDFDLAMRVNLQGTLNILEACRAAGPATRLVFASSLAAFGGDAMPATVGDDTKQTPQSTYGVTKSIGELLVNDYSRKGFLDGRSARLPTIIIRPGKPNEAASSFCSAIFREPLNGEEAFLPVAEDFVHPVLGYRDAVAGLIRLMEVDAGELGSDRAYNLPSLAVSAAEMMAAVQRAGRRYGREPGPIIPKPDARIRAIVETWPGRMDSRRALGLGLPVSESLDAIIDDYLADYGG